VHRVFVVGGCEDGEWDEGYGRQRQMCIKDKSKGLSIP